MAAGGGALWLRSRSTGTLVAPEPAFTLLLRHGRSAAVRPFEGRDGRISLPSGQYRLTGWRARRRDDRGRVWEIASALGEPERPVEVRPGQASRLRLAEPVEPALVVEQSGANVIFHLRLKGAGGETIGEVRADGHPVPPPSLRIEDDRGRVVGRLQFEDTCGAGCAQSWRAPAGLAQPLHAIPEANLGLFAIVPATFRFRLEERSPAPEVSAGRPAPDFTLPSLSNNHPVRLSSLRGRPMVLGFFCGCGLCQAAARRLAPELAAQRVSLLAIFENERQLQPEQLARFRLVTGFHGPILADRGGRVTRRYLGLACPRLWVIDARGTVRYTNPNPRTPPATLSRAVAQALHAARS